MATTLSHTNSGINRITITDGSGNVTGINAQQVIVPAPANVSIPGGNAGDVLSTDGNGNLYWAAPGSGTVISSELSNGSSNVVVDLNGNIRFSSGGVANVMSVGTSGIVVTVNTVLPALSNVKISGGSPTSVLFSDGFGGLRWGGNFLLPQAGTGQGWLIANGLRLYRSGNGNVNYVSSWRTTISTFRPQSVPVLHDDMPTITAWTKIHTNESCLYALGNNGVLYSQGIDNNGQQGNTTANVINEVLTPITHNTIYGAGITVLNFWSYDRSVANDISNGAVLVNVNDNGTLRTYMFGYNYSGELGNGTASTSNQVPVLITQLAGKTIANVSFVRGMIMVATSDGELWVCGDNYSGQLGQGNITDPIKTFVRATKSDGSFFTNAVRPLFVYTSDSTVSSFVLCSDGTVWACGANGGSFNYLGLNSSLANITRFTQLTISGTVTKIDGCNRATVALDSSGNLWSWGVNVEGYWGTGGTFEVSFSPRIIQRNVIDAWIISAPVVDGSKNNRSLVWVDTEYRTWGAGTNNNNSLGVNSSSSPVASPSSVSFRTDDEYPIQVKPLGVLTTSSDSVATMWLTNRNRIYISGANSDAGALAKFSSSETTFKTPYEITNIL